jgi:ketosteroid isomerase-like protein
MTDPWPEHPNATAYRDAAVAFRGGDIEKIRTLIDDDVVWHVPGDHPMAGDVIGIDALVSFLNRLREIGFTLREHDVFGSDAHVCALSEMGAKRPGTDISTRVVSVFHFRNGRQIERWLYPEDMSAWSAIFEVA